MILVSRLPETHLDLKARIAALESERSLTLKLAQTDSLTGLMNRGAFTDALAQRLETAAASGKRVVLLVIDLDRFKHLNDTLGHHAGDLLLAEVGARLRADAGRGEIAARLGGDEFALITDVEDVARRAQRLVDVLSQPQSIYGRAVLPGASVGAAVYPTDASDPDALQRFADMALYRVKDQAGGVRWSVFDDQLRADGERRKTLEATLRRAMLCGEIEPWFQPVADAASGRIVGVEMLARWRHPDEGVLEPASFLPIAEELGLIGRIDEAVFETACARAAPWVADGLIDTLACNVSQRDLLDPGFSRKLLGRLKRTSLPPTALVVELTESFLLHDLALARRHIERLASRGVRIALDDFGTGYSNLRVLMGLPIQALKLDGSLIADLGTDRRVSLLVSAMLQTARNLGVEVVAEGVETEAQALFLRAAGCGRMQGYWYGRPAPWAEMDALLRAAAAPAAQPEPVPEAHRRLRRAGV